MTGTDGDGKVYMWFKKIQDGKLFSLLRRPRNYEIIQLKMDSDKDGLNYVAENCMTRNYFLLCWLFFLLLPAVAHRSCSFLDRFKEQQVYLKGKTLCMCVWK